MSTCGCLSSAPATLARLRPPPDPSLVWHLLSDEPFVKAPDCEWSPLDGFSPDLVNETTPPFLIALASFFLFVLTLAIVCAICLIRKRRSSGKGGAALSTEAIVTSGDHLWSYNSMKSNHHSVLPSHHNSMGNSIYGTAIVHGMATPASMRHYNNNPGLAYPQGNTNHLKHTTSAQFLRQSTLRLIPGDQPTAASPFHTLGRHYEEIADHPRLPFQVNRDGVSYTLGQGRPPLPPGRHYDHVTPPARHSVRKPPPTCRPPPPPSSEELSPRSSSSGSSSFEHELNGLNGRNPDRITQDSPPSRSYEDEVKGRESGYGTAPSRQWRTPPGSAGKGMDEPPLHPAPPPHHPSQMHPSTSMTYV